MFWQNAHSIAWAFIIIMIFSSLNGPFTNTPAYSQTAESHVSQEKYDKIKNCTKDLSKKPTSVEYLTHFNCGHVSKDESGRTVRQFTLIVQEHQKIPISYEGHMFEGWTFNGTIPGPTMRVTEGDLVRIRLINTNDNAHGHSLYTQSIHYAKNNILSMTGYPGGTISPGRSFTYEFTAGPYGVYPYYCHEEPTADHINRGLYGIMIIDPKDPRPQMTEMAMLLNGYDLDLDMEGPTSMPHIASTGDKGTNKPEQSNTNQTNIDTNMSNLTRLSLPSNQEEIASDKTVIKEKRGNEIYTVNGRAFDYMMNPIVLYTGKPYRVFIINMLEFDMVNSIHVHGAMFDYYSAGTQ